jgi:hypothetical protein
VRTPRKAISVTFCFIRAESCSPLEIMLMIAVAT